MEESVQANIKIDVLQKMKEAWESERATLPSFIKAEDVEQTFYTETYHKILKALVQKAKNEMAISKWLPKEMVNILAKDVPLMTMLQKEYEKNEQAGMTKIEAHLNESFEAAVNKVPLFMQSAMRDARKGLRQQSIIL